ncbi:ATP-binding protein [Pantoea sp. Eser]|nr:ATP-binding protein [Pantoea sp. Eser]
MAAFIATEEEKDQLQKVTKSFVDIFMAQEALDIIRKVHIDPDIMMLTAEPGYGKTTVLEEYAARHSSAIKIDAVAPSPYALLRELCEELDLASNGSAHDMVRRCVKQLKRHPGKLIMVDESEFLSSDALNTLRRIHDLADVGLVLAGTKHLVTTVANEPQRESFEQVLASLLPVVNGVNYMENPRAVRAFWRYSGAGGYRYLFKLVKSVVSCMSYCDKGITPTLIKECAEGLVHKSGLTR